MSINKILAIRNDRFGEFLLNIPAFEALKQNYPGATLTLAVDSYVQELAKRITFVDEVIIWENRKHNFSQIAKFAKELKRKKYDLCVIFNPSREFNIISFLAGIALRAGYNRKWGFLLNRKIEDKKSEGLRHEVEYNLELLKTVGIKAELSDFHFPLEIKEEDFSDRRLSGLGINKLDFIAIHPWASNKEKEWPQDKFKELIIKITNNLSLKCVVIGGSEELVRSTEFSKGLPVTNLTGKTSLIELAALLKKTKLLVTNDSGPMHLAAAVGTPVVAIFRKSRPAVSAGRWGPAGKNHVVIENDVLADIRVDEVLNGIKKLLK